MTALRLVLATALIALLVAPPAAAQERTPQQDYMIHMDLSQPTPRYIPNELTLVPGGLVQLMLFGKGPSHSITLDTADGQALVPPGEQDGFYERVAQFNGPAKPGDYAFHDVASGARGVIHVRAASATPAPANIGVRENGYDLHFDPERLEVEPGATITWSANGTFAHTLTSATSAWNDSGLALRPGQSATFTAPTTPGEYPFFCRYHKDSGMRAILVVKGPAASDPSTQTPTPSTPTSATKPAPGLAVPLIIGLIIIVALARRKTQGD